MTQEDYEKMLKRIEEIQDAEPDTPDGVELSILAQLVQEYEEQLELDGSETLTEKDVIEYLIEVRGIKREDITDLMINSFLL